MGSKGGICKTSKSGSMSGSGDVESKGRRSRTSESGSGGVGSKGCLAERAGTEARAKAAAWGSRGELAASKSVVSGGGAGNHAFTWQRNSNSDLEHTELHEVQVRPLVVSTQAP